MQHIMQIAFDFDDDRVRGIAEKRVEDDMNRIIRDIVTDRIAPMETSWGGKKERNWQKLEKMVKDYVSALVDEHKDEIIQKAAEMLCDSYKRTKAWKEKASDVIA